MEFIVKQGRPEDYNQRPEKEQEVLFPDPDVYEHRRKDMLLQLEHQKSREISRLLFGRERSKGLSICAVRLFRL